MQTLTESGPDLATAQASCKWLHQLGRDVRGKKYSDSKGVHKEALDKDVQVIPGQYCGPERNES